MLLWCPVVYLSVMKSFYVCFVLTGGPGQLPHLAPTYAAVCALCTIGTVEAYRSIDRFVSFCILKYISSFLCLVYLITCGCISVCKDEDRAENTFSCVTEVEHI